MWLSWPFNSLPHNPDLKKKPFENIVGKGENAGNQHFLLFPHYFPPFPKRISITLILSSANASNLEQFKRLSSGKVLNAFHNYSYICSQWRSKSNCTKSLIYGLHCSFSWNTIKKKKFIHSCLISDIIIICPIFNLSSASTFNLSISCRWLVEWCIHYFQQHFSYISLTYSCIS